MSNADLYTITRVQKVLPSFYTGETSIVTIETDAVDMLAHESLNFIFDFGEIDIGSWNVKYYHADLADLSDQTEVSNSDLIGRIAYFNGEFKNSVMQVGYTGNKRYVLIGLQSSAEIISNFGIIAILNASRHN